MKKIVIEKFKQKNSSTYQVVNIHRGKIDSYPMRCVVVEVFDDFVVVQNVNDSLFLDGYSIIYTDDITSIETHPNNNFYKRVFKKRKQSPKRLNLKFHDLVHLLKLCQRKFKLTALHLEKISRTKCIIGRLAQSWSNHIDVLEISPSGVWSRRVRKIKFADITKFDFGGGYENALVLGASGKTPGAV